MPSIRSAHVSPVLPVLLLGATVVAAGCLGEGGPLDPADPSIASAAGGIVATVGDALPTAIPMRVTLPVLEGPRADAPPLFDLFTGSGDCRDDAACLQVPLRLDIPEGFWSTTDAQLELNVRAQPGDYAGTLRSTLLTADGGHVARGEGGKYAQLFLLGAAEAGDYVLELRAFDGVVAAELYVGLEEPAPVYDGPVIDLLPDLVMLAPLDLKVDLPFWSNTLDGVPYPEPLRTITATTTPGCTPDEATEGGSRRCLRVSTGVGNVGAGPLEVRMPSDDPLAPWALPGGYLQRVHRSDGSTYDRDAGSEGTFHLTHAHLHYPNLVRLQVFEYDPETGLRGPEVGKGSKTGFCLVSEGLVDVGMPGSSPPRWPSEGTCFNYPTSRADWAMGVWPQWFDMYETYRSGQHAEISGVADGVYVFVVTADPEDSILESDETNNENSVVFRLTGNEVEILGPET